MMQWNSYILIEDIKTGEILRFPRSGNNEIPKGYRKKETYQTSVLGNRQFAVYDENDKLKPQFWGVREKTP